MVDVRDFREVIGDTDARALVVSVDRGLIAACERFLPEFGFVVDHADGSDSCLKKLYLKTPHLLLFDCESEDEDTGRLMRCLLSDRRLSGVAVVLLTGEEQDDLPPPIADRLRPAVAGMRRQIDGAMN